MNFSTESRIATVRRNQTQSRPCYTNALRKFMDQGVHVINDVKMDEITVDFEKIDEAPVGGDEINLSETDDLIDLDPRISEVEPQTTPAEKLECLYVDRFDPLKELQIGSGSKKI
ncbi:Uncharacterized protein Adt_05820 [Abeliophyllum distichum]|uniref:Uncharacterized protein n=1 Tax=Abeliophyllum distichum TaxID=126358 RepID=A0ABD1V559_9LAMI